MIKTKAIGTGRRKLAAMACATVVLAGAESALAQVPGRCEVPVSQRAGGEAGCYLTATESLGAMSADPVYWHLYNYPTRAAADAVKGPNSAVVGSFDKVWLYTIAEQGWRPPSGERVAVIGPLPVMAGRPYTARYMEAVFTPGMRAPVHRHSGPEAWFLVSGVQCLETPDGMTIARAGEGAVVPEGPPMALSSVGNETRQSVLLVLHDASQPWITLANDWQPKGLCPK
jgi:quercetin dioxygenase-like cupin family protein